MDEVAVATIAILIFIVGLIVGVKAGASSEAKLERNRIAVECASKGSVALESATIKCEVERNPETTHTKNNDQ